jgi:hypothetical protein
MLRSLPAHLATELESVALEVTLEQFLTNDLPAVQSWDIVAIAHHWDEIDTSGNHRQERIATINIAIGALTHASLWDQLDSLEGDLSTVGAAVLDLKEGDLRDDLLDQLEGMGSKLLILNSVKLTDRWRGYGVGALLAGEAILALYGDAQCVATYPAPLDGSTGADRARAVKKLERVWAQLGFEAYRDGVWVIDPGLVTLRDSVERMKRNFHLT